MQACVLLSSKLLASHKEQLTVKDIAIRLSLRPDQVTQLRARELIVLEVLPVATMARQRVSHPSAVRPPPQDRTDSCVSFVDDDNYRSDELLVEASFKAGNNI